MKRERRVLGITGDETVVVSVLYRGKLWLEALSVKRVKSLPQSIEGLIPPAFLDQAGLIVIDNEFIDRCGDIDVSKLLSLGRPIMVFGGAKPLNQEGDLGTIKYSCIEGSLPEALRAARKIFNEVRRIIGELKPEER
ncbi:MAG: hypothetical protein QFX33_03770 [Candidatus Nezhaarchaeota archaeon]|nr:hypothetical protein [Candidatus Nezhaarchaeota archaeon]